MIPLAQAPAPDGVTALAPYLAGPGAAVIVLLLVGAAAYRLVDSAVLPMLGKAIDRHLAQIDALIATQREESKAVTRTLASIDHRLARIEGLTDAGAFGGNPGAPSPDRLT